MDTTITTTHYGDTIESQIKTGDGLVKKGVLLSLFLVIIYVILDYTVPGLGYVSDILTAFLEWVEDNPALGAVAFSVVYVISTILFIPGLFLTLGAGLVFGRALGVGVGVLVGTISVFTGATIGSILAFLIGRFVLRNQAQSLFDKFKVLKAIDKVIETQGLKLVILMRLSPFIPYSAFNYVMGVTMVPLKSYALGCVGMIPGTAAYVFIGTSASGLLGDDSEEGEEETSGDDMVQLIVIIVGAIATVLVVAIVSVYAKRALNKAIADEEEDAIGLA